MTRELGDWKLTTATEMIVSDTAANQMGVFNLELAPDLPRHFKPAKCVCHVLQLCINDCILLKPSIARIVKDCRFFLYFHLRFIEFRSVCTHANLSTNFCTDLREVQLQLNPEGTALLLK